MFHSIFFLDWTLSIIICLNTVLWFQVFLILIKESPYGVMVKVLDCRCKVSEFKLQSGSYIHFQTNNLWKDIKPLIPPTG